MAVTWPASRSVRVAVPRPWRAPSVAVLAALVLVAALAPVLAPADPAAQSLDQLAAPSGAHLLGTDALGRDVLSRILYALRTDMVLMVLAAGLPMVVGTLVGAVAGFAGGVVDAAVRWLADIVQALPVYVLLIALVFALGAGATSLLVAFGLLGWVVYARVARIEVRRVREREFVAASYLVGLSRPAVLVRHVLPNALRQTFVYFTTDLGLALQGIAVLSFFGLGVKPSTPELGAMVADGQLFLRGHWWLAGFPGLAIVLLGATVAAVGDRLTGRAQGETS